MLTATLRSATDYDDANRQGVMKSGVATAKSKPIGFRPRRSGLPPSCEERYAAGKALRDRVSREDHGKWSPPSDRHEPVDMVIESSKGRVPELIPIRYGRMMVSPFTFYRGTANIMAADLASTSASGMLAQLCGDCHLLNFGGFATPERSLIFDINDFDETHPGPWEWDLKRLVASFVMAARSNGFSKADQRGAAQTCAQSYREHMARFANMPTLDVWYAALGVEKMMDSLKDKKSRTRLRKRIRKQKARNVIEHDFPKLAAKSGDKYLIRDNPPCIYHHQRFDLAQSQDIIKDAFTRYRETLSNDRKVLLDRYRMVDLALKVVGVGSVGTFCAIALMMAKDDDPLFLQIKEAGRSVLETYVGKSVYEHHGERVVTGQRLMQSASDIFLGWTQGEGGRHFYIRQLRDMKMKALVEIFNPTTLIDYATVCGWTLARAHAKSGDSAMIAGYLGKSDVFDRAVTHFSELYADQAERDHAAFMKAIREGRIDVEVEH
jgi:uncharacterized protein (DUF2252 family)